MGITFDNLNPPSYEEIIKQYHKPEYLTSCMEVENERVAKQQAKEEKAADDNTSYTEVTTETSDTKQQNEFSTSVKMAALRDGGNAPLDASLKKTLFE